MVEIVFNTVQSVFVILHGKLSLAKVSWQVVVCRESAQSTDLARVSSTSSGQSQSVLREQTISPFKTVRHHGHSCYRYDRPKPNRGIQLAENLDADNPLAPRKPTVNFRHEVVHASAVFLRRKIRCRDVGE